MQLKKFKEKQYLYAKTLYVKLNNWFKKAAVRFVADLKKGSIKNIFSISGIAKLIFMYVSCVFYVIIITVEFSPGIFTNNAPHTVAIYSVRARIGENALYTKTIRAAKKMGWNYVGIMYSEALIRDSFTAHLFWAATNVVNFIVHTDFNLSVTPYVNIVPSSGYNITYLNLPNDMTYSLDHKFKKYFEHLAKYDAYVDIISITTENDLLHSALKNHNNEDALIIPAYFAQEFKEFIAPTEYKRAIFTGSRWGCNRESLRFADALSMLAKDKLAVFYGLDDAFSYLGDAYLGFISKNDAVDEILNVQRECGISLIAHTLEHSLQSIPTSRISEAIISGSVVISDEHPFIRKYFGDNVLYFNSFGNAKEIYHQVKAHINWVKANPIEAQKMAKNAYDILVKDWTIEIQLQKIMDAVNKNKI